MIVEWLKQENCKALCISCAVIFVVGVLVAIKGYTAVSELMYGVSLCTAHKHTAVMVQQSPPYVIAIDPGHGGMDTGAQAIVEEYQVIDQTADFLYRLLEADENFIPVMTRTDTDPESGPRADVANSAGANLLISIHANCDSHKSSKGFECFPTPPGRTYHQQSLKFAEIVVELMRGAGHTIRGNEQKTGIKYAYYYGNEKRIVDSDDDKIRSRKSFGVLEKTNCPRLLVEQCFVSNYDDVQNWASPEGCERAAQLYYKAIKQYFLP